MKTDNLNLTVYRVLRPEITDPKIIRENEIFLEEALKRGGFQDPDLDAMLEEMEAEPGFWEEMAELSEQIWPSKKPSTEQDSSAPEAPEGGL